MLKRFSTIPSAGQRDRSGGGRRHRRGVRGGRDGARQGPPDAADCGHRRDARLFSADPHDQQQPLPDRRLRERGPVVRADRGGRVFRRGRSAERARRAAELAGWRRPIRRRRRAPSASASCRSRRGDAPSARRRWSKAGRGRARSRRRPAVSPAAARSASLLAAHPAAGLHQSARDADRAAHAGPTEDRRGQHCRLGAASRLLSGHCSGCAGDVRDRPRRLHGRVDGRHRRAR